MHRNKRPDNQPFQIASHWVSRISRHERTSKVDLAAYSMHRTWRSTYSPYRWSRSGRLIQCLEAKNEVCTGKLLMLCLCCPFSSKVRTLSNFISLYFFACVLVRTLLVIRTKKIRTVWLFQINSDEARRKAVSGDQILFFLELECTPLYSWKL